MKLGLFGIGSGPCAHPAVARAIATRAEERGFESLWTGEHVVLPDPQAPPSPAPPEFPMLHPSVVLAHLAAVTTRVKLGTGIVLLPQRNPVVLAKELASLDVVSGGRLLFGFGVGYLKPEFDALGVSFEERGARSDEYIAAMRALWSEDKPSFEGRFVSFRDIQARPQPVQRPHPPIIVGGMSRHAFRRAVSYANGWYGFYQDPEATQRCLDGLKEAEDRYGRPAELGELEISITPPARLDDALVARYAKLGVHRLIPSMPARDPAKLEEFVDGLAGAFIGG